MRRPIINLKRIASELGVSVTTVSKVLNGHGDIGDATRARVLEKVDELGYHRNLVARSLILQNTHTLGVLIPDLMHSFFIEILASLETIVNARGYAVCVGHTGEQPDKERRELAVFCERRVDGIVLAPVHATANRDLLTRIARSGTGLVMVDRDEHADLSCHHVLTDDHRVGELAASHLIAQGHRAIGHIAGPPLVHARRREEGYRQAMAQHDLSVRPEWIVEAGFREEHGYHAMKTLLRVRPRITAVFAVNDPTAIGAMKAMWETDVRIPDDVAVVGAGDVGHVDLLRVPLSTVAWSRLEMGRHAAGLLLDHIESDPARPFQRVIVPPELIVRESSAQ